jgi:hypothetical protein
MKIPGKSNNYIWNKQTYTFVDVTFTIWYQPLVGLVMIDDEFDREDHGLIAAIATGTRLKPLDTITNPRIRLNW